MGNRVKGLTVAIEADMREDDIESIVNAILMVKGVVNVTTHPVDHTDYMNRERIRNEYRDKVWELFQPTAKEVK